jgi:hypothetical protein
MAAKTIVLKGRGIRNEAVANAAITPGHLVELMSTGKIRVHATAGGNAAALFAVEDDLQGKTIDDAYAANAIAQYEAVYPGCEVQAWIADGQNIAIGDFLESAGGGELQKHTADVDLNNSSGDFTVNTNQIVAVAMEACNMSGSAKVDPSGKCRVRIV